MHQITAHMHPEDRSFSKEQRQILDNVFGWQKRVDQQHQCASQKRSLKKCTGPCGKELPEVEFSKKAWERKGFCKSCSSGKGRPKITTRRCAGKCKQELPFETLTKKQWEKKGYCKDCAQHRQKWGEDTVSKTWQQNIWCSIRQPSRNIVSYTSGGARSWREFCRIFVCTLSCKIDIISQNVEMLCSV